MKTMSIYDQRIEQLSEQFDLDALLKKEADQLDIYCEQGRQKLRNTVAKASKKKGFANSPVAKKLQEKHLFQLVEQVGASFVLAVLADRGERVAEHQQILRHFAIAWRELLILKGEDDSTQDLTQLLNVKQWVYIALSMMLDAAAMPESNDHQIKRSRSERRRFEDEDKLPKRPSIQTVQQEIGEMILFQTRMTFYRELFPFWFRVREKEATKEGAIGLRYYLRDMDHHMRERRSYLSLKVGKTQEEDTQLALISHLEDLPQFENNLKFVTVLGSWLYSLIYDFTELFAEKQPTLKSPKKLILLDYAESLRDAWSEQLKRSVLKRPMIAPPAEMTADRRGGRMWSAEKPTVKTHKGALECSQTRLDFFNNQALVPYQLNPFVMKLLDHLKERAIGVGSFDYYIAEPLPLPSDLLEGKPADFDRWSEQEQYLWCKAQPGWKQAKQTISRRREAQIQKVRKTRASREIYATANDFRDVKQFWFPVKPEFRGRLIVDNSDFHPQGSDTSKALIWLAIPVEVTTENKATTRFWMANHLASNYGDGLDKKPFSARMNWIADPVTVEKITAVALMHEKDFALGLKVLKEVEAADGKPLMFAAACREWYELFIAQSKTTTQLLCGVDATCSGQQFAAAWRRSKRLAVATNVIGSQEGPQDLYGLVYLALHEKIRNKLSERHERDLRLRGLGRAIVKGGMQPMQYGSCVATGVDGIRKKIEKMRDKGIIRLSDKEVAALVKAFPKALAEVAEMHTANAWFRHFSELCAEAGKTEIIIPTALGDHVTMRYEQGTGFLVETFRYGQARYKQQKPRHTVTLVEPNGTPDTVSWRTALSANTVHSGDSTLLAIALCDVDFGFSSNHDAVYCAACHVPEVRDRMRAAFVKVGSMDMFQALQEANGVFVEPGTVDDPVVGDWTTIEDVLTSDYFVN